MGASPMWLPVTSTARISNVSSSIPRRSLRQTRRFGGLMPEGAGSYAKPFSATCTPP
jgi:hypothetical protein